MKKKLDTRIPAARIKKIMQTDEDIGKIALHVPVLVSKALEIFLRSLCGRTCAITLQGGTKTISVFHLKQCIQRFNVFDFLQGIVSKVPDTGGSHTRAEGRPGAKRRKANDEIDNESNEELKRSKMGSCRGRARGRGRRRGSRGSKSSARNVIVSEKFEDDLYLSPEHSDTQVRRLEGHTELNNEAHASKEKLGTTFVRDFDLNLGLDENGDIAMPQSNVKQEEQYLSSSHSDGEDVTMYPLQLQMQLGRTIDQDEDDYDNEDE